ncbi:fatty acid desaturase [Gloeobacter kilaueensis]|uniref:Fatty acid desaturase n=1 Tax=Gloeobacter kilaueensis (strain ATCC BAA-2537 / CCAP 1431/1 / ULC 316 / JS1) TaxID=1183438 RepID=U5QHZ8_GLOK1|nr:fatty acid desaturase [Gloeobacter kilaueensis]AGY58493.1 fatty acid desaturase [Gloeobacter kilaueensis JS1]
MVQPKSIAHTRRHLDQQRIAALEKQASLNAVIRTIPKACFEIDAPRAWSRVALNVVLVGLGYLAIAYAPWWLLPIAWIYAGTALTGFFVLAHDCGHRSFSTSRRTNDIVGHVLLLPLLYPFHGWRLKHNQHHTYTNQIERDNAWRPLSVAEYRALPPLARAGYRFARGWGWWFASAVHQFTVHFRPSLFQAKDQADARLSVAVVAGFACLLFPGLWLLGGPWAIVSFWLIPWLVYHFWMSTFTLVHHTHPDVPFYPAAHWTPVTAQLFSTVHCAYPAWVEFLCHDINVHIPHHVSTAIPSYHLRRAHAALRTHWSDYLHETEFSWPLLRSIVRDCHLSDETGYYVPCRNVK